MIDIREYPGVLDALNQTLNSGKEAVVCVEDGDLLSVAEHARFWLGQFERGAEHRKSKPRQYNNR